MKIIESTPPISLANYIRATIKDGKKQFQNVTLTLRGREAISLALHHFGLGKQDTILLPGYLCEIIDGPLINKFNIEYYDIEEDFSINTETIESILRSRKIKVLYIIHYFGFLHKNLNQLSDLCKKYGVLLWEDHAHSALSKFSFEYADAMIFSFRKILPVPDGGGLWLMNSPVLKLGKIDNLYSDIISMLIVLKRSKLGMNSLFRAKTRQIARASTASTFRDYKATEPKPVSHMSKKIIQNADVQSLFSIRRNIFMKWQDLLSRSRFSPVFSHLPDDVCPQGFPVRIQNSKEILPYFEDLNMFIKIHWPLSSAMKTQCPTAFNISNSIITLPIYPGISSADMERITKVLEQYGKPIHINN